MKNQLGILESQQFFKNFQVGDIIHWKEAIWTDRPQFGQNRLAGEQEVTGEIVHFTEKSASIRIKSANITDMRLPASGQSELIAHEVGKVISKRITTLVKGGVAKVSGL